MPSCSAVASRPPREAHRRPRARPRGQARVQPQRAARPPASLDRPTSSLSQPQDKRPRFGGAFFWDNASMNADPAELEKFGQLAHRWWAPQGEFRPLHEINPLRLGWIDERASLAGRRVLDVGCGGGILAEAMAGRGAEVTGIDLSEKSLRVAELHLLQSKAQVTYERVTAEDYAQRRAGEFDVVTCMELL